MSEKNIHLMRAGLDKTISNSLMFSEDKKSPHAGLYLQRGLCKWDKDDPDVKSGNKKSAKENLIHHVSTISFSPLYKLAYERWEKMTSNSQRFAFTHAKIVGRLYTGLSSATALETGLTTHHTYGMPMLAGSSVKGATAAYAEKIGLPKNVCQILFGDEDNAGAVVWHDAWWIPKGKPFVGEIITPHHQDYYNGTQKHADEMENPIPNQQIACQGSFYFVVECDNTAWANFANRLLSEMLHNQGMGSKTASGYGYFTLDESEQNHFNAQREEQAKKRAEEEKAAQLAALPEHERLVKKWTSLFEALKKLKEEKENYKMSTMEITEKYNELKADLNYAINELNQDQQKWIAEQLAFKSVLQAEQPKWFEGKREKEIKSLLNQLKNN